MYDPLLKARREALSELSVDLNDAAFVIAEKAIDTYLDKLDYEFGHAEKITRNPETGMLKVWDAHDEQS